MPERSCRPAVEAQHAAVDVEPGAVQRQAAGPTRSAIHGNVIRLASDSLIASRSQACCRSSGGTELITRTRASSAIDIHGATNSCARDRRALQQRAHATAQARVPSRSRAGPASPERRTPAPRWCRDTPRRVRTAAPGWPRCARSAISARRRRRKSSRDPSGYRCTPPPCGRRLAVPRQRFEDPALLGPAIRAKTSVSSQKVFHEP